MCRDLSVGGGMLVVAGSRSLRMDLGCRMFGSLRGPVIVVRRCLQSRPWLGQLEQP